MIRPRRFGPWLVLMLSAVASPGISGRAGAWDGGHPTVDCGPAAVAMLLDVTGHSVPFDRVVARLPARPGGHSMLELRDLAGSFGLTLDGRFVGQDGAAIDRPMLAYLKAGSFRHFLIVRPVGHSGSLVQVIDFQQPPRVMDRTELVRSPQWTGSVLAPRSRFAGWATSGAGFALLTASVVALARLGPHLGANRR